MRQLLSKRKMSEFQLIRVNNMKKFRTIVQVITFACVVIPVFAFNWNVEAFCPFGAVETFYTYLSEGSLICSLGTGNFFVLFAVLILTLFFRRVFCGYFCPIGAAGEFFRQLAKDFNIKQIAVPYKLERLIGLFRYIVLIAVLYLTVAAATLVFRDISPCYALVCINDDIKISTYISIAVIIIASFIISMPFCRWVCPFAVVQNVFSRFSPAKITRNLDTCINCGKCSKSCPMNIDVANMKKVCSADCISCFECVDCCPVKDEHNGNIIKPLSWRFGGKIDISKPKRVLQISFLAAILFVIYAYFFIEFDTYIYESPIERPLAAEQLVLEIEGVSCAGSSKLLVFFLNREDILKVDGYLRVATRPRTGWVKVKIDYDPIKTDTLAIKEAIMEPYYDNTERRWRPSPFSIKGKEIWD